MFMFMQKLIEFCIVHSNDILHVQYNVRTLLVVNASQTSILPSWLTHTHTHTHMVITPQQSAIKQWSRHVSTSTYSNTLRSSKDSALAWLGAMLASSWVERGSVVRQIHEELCAWLPTAVRWPEASMQSLRNDRNHFITTSVHRTTVSTTCEWCGWQYS